VVLCIQVWRANGGFWRANGGVCLAPLVVRRSPASVHQSGQSLDLEPELVSLPSCLLCVLRRVVEKGSLLGSRVRPTAVKPMVWPKVQEERVGEAEPELGRVVGGRRSPGARGRPARRRRPG
jgi:hypothetical protein